MTVWFCWCSDVTVKWNRSVCMLRVCVVAASSHCSESLTFMLPEQQTVQNPQTQQSIWWNSRLDKKASFYITMWFYTCFLLLSSFNGRTASEAEIMSCWSDKTTWIRHLRLWKIVKETNWLFEKIIRWIVSCGLVVSDSWRWRVVTCSPSNIQPAALRCQNQLLYFEYKRS